MGFGFQPRKQRANISSAATLTADEAQTSGAHSPSLPPALGFPSRSLRNGGPIRGPGTGTSDSITARVPAGSFVMPADTTQQIGDEALADMGARGFPPRSQRRPQSADGVDVRLSNGEHLLTPEQVHAVGVQTLTALKDATHEQIGEGYGFAPGRSEDAMFFANGGEVKTKEEPGTSERWTTFDEGSGSLGVPRSEMPQIKAEHRSALVGFLKSRGIDHEEETLPAFAFKPTQAEYSPERVQRARDFKGGDRAILVSQDGHVLDGHHQWLASLIDDGDVRVLRMDAPMRALLGVASQFPSATTDKASEGGSASPNGEQRYADGGEVDPLGSTSNVTRVGNSYSGGNVAGQISINGSAPGGTVNSIGAPVAPAAPSITPTAAATSVRTLPAAAPAPGLGIIDSSAQRQQFFDRAASSTAASRGARPAVSPGAPLAPVPGGLRPPGGFGPTAATSGASSATSELGGFGFGSTAAQAYRRGNTFSDTAAGAMPGAMGVGSISPQSMGAADALADRYGARGFPPGYATGGLITPEEALRRQQSGATGDVIMRRPPVNMGMADVVQPEQLPPGRAAASAVSSPAASGVAAQAPAAAPAGELIGRRPSVNMGAAEVVHPTRLPAVVNPSAAPGAGSGFGFPVGRAVAGAGAALGVGVEGKQVYDVATNPNATGLDVATQAAQGVGRLSAASAGASGGAAMGSAFGPVGSIAGGVIGGGLGYLAADRAIAGGRAALGADPRSPAERLAPPAAPAAPEPQGGGGAVFGVYPQPSSQFSTNLNDAALQRGVVATGPRSFEPAPPAASPPAATMRFNNLTDPRSLEYRGGGAPAAPTASTAYGEPLTDAMAGFGAVPPAAASDAPSGLPPGVTRTGNSFSGTNVGTPATVDPSALGGLADTNARLARLQESNAAVPQGGMSVIDNSGPAAAQAMFDGANLRTAAARGSWSPRRGFQGDEGAVRAAALPIQQRAEAENLQAREQGATNRTALQLAFDRARERRAEQQQATQNDLARQRIVQQDLQFQQSNAVDRARLNIEAGKASAALNKDSLQQAKDTQDVFSILSQAEPLLAVATNSTLGNAYDRTAQFFGGSTQGAEAAAQLKALQGALVSKMPKMSGPQSDKDVLLYREMAGQIGDPTIPREQRQAAMQTIRALNEKYLPMPSDSAGVANLPSGATFRAPDGTIRRKP